MLLFVLSGIPKLDCDFQPEKDSTAIDSHGGWLARFLISILLRFFFYF